MHNSRPAAPAPEHVPPLWGSLRVASPVPPVVSPGRNVHLLRRLGAMVYDALLLLGVLFVAGLPLPLIPAPLRDEPVVRFATLVYILLVAFLFFGWFWTHGGQTLGMRAWRIRIVGPGGAPPGWRLAWRRFALAMVSWAPLGLGFLWSLVDRERLAWHDHLSGTRLAHLPPGSVAPQQDHANGQENEGR